MGRKGSWFSSVRKIFNPHSKKYQERQRSIEEELGKQDDLEAALPIKDSPFAVSSAFTPTEGFKFSEVENERSKRAYSVALATAVAAEAAVAAAKAAAEVVRLTNVPIYLGKSKEEMAAIKIQTAFRGYLARRALRALKGLVRLKKLIEGKSVKRQSASTLQCMQTLTRLQSQVRERRAKMSEENQALQQQLQLKHEKEAEKLHAFIAEEWNDSTRSKEQVEARISKRQEAAVRRERALAYAFSHQQKWRNSKSVNPNTFMDPNNPHWGWSWVDRWMVVRPSESQSAIDHSDHGSFKSASSQPMSVGQMTKLNSLRDQHHNTKPSRAGQKSSLPPSTPPSKIPSTSHKVRAASSKGSSWGRDDDSRSSLSVQSERYYRRHTISGSLPRDDESLASSPSVPSYKVSTKPSNPKSRLRTASSSTSPSADKKGTAQNQPLVSVKKRLSFPDSPTGSSRKHSVSPKVYATDGGNGR